MPPHSIHYRRLPHTCTIPRPAVAFFLRHHIGKPATTDTSEDNDMYKALCLLIGTLLIAPAHPADLTFKQEFLKILAQKAPGILKTYDPATGRFGSGIWIVTDQNVMLPLAVLYSTEGEGNLYYQDSDILNVLIKAGDALIEDADAKGQWEFRKKDGSTWGKIFMPWTYSRWVR